MRGDTTTSEVPRNADCPSSDTLSTGLMGSPSALRGGSSPPLNGIDELAEVREAREAYFDGPPVVPDLVLNSLIRKPLGKVSTPLVER